jgi:hypothetical protein
MARTSKLFTGTLGEIVDKNFSARARRGCTDVEGGRFQARNCTTEILLLGSNSSTLLGRSDSVIVCFQQFYSLLVYIEISDKQSKCLCGCGSVLIRTEPLKSLIWPAENLGCPMSHGPWLGLVAMTEPPERFATRRHGESHGVGTRQMLASGESKNLDFLVKSAVSVVIHCLYT